MDSVKEQIAARVTSFLGSLSGKYPVRAAFLFGSWAEGRAVEDSDIDVGIVLDGEVGRAKRHELFALGKEFDPVFDVVVFSAREFRSEDAVIVHEILTKGIRVA